MRILQSIILLFLSCNTCMSQITDTFFQHYPFLEVQRTSNTIRDTTVALWYNNQNFTLQLKNNNTDYKVYNSKGKLIEEGKADYGRRCIDCMGRTGKWIFYYDNGNKSAEGNFYRHNPIGLWKQYFSNGNLMKMFSYVPIGKDSVDKNICLAGSYVEKYENGQTKIEGLYQAMVDTSLVDTIHYENPTGEKTLVTLHVYGAHPVKYGEWLFYKENGGLLKKENY